VSDLSGTGESQRATRHAQDQPRFKLDLNSFKFAESCVNHRKSSTTRIWTNFISMESLGRVEFISVVYFQGF
jgi:hypothetical protein